MEGGVGSAESMAALLLPPLGVDPVGAVSATNEVRRPPEVEDVCKASLPMEPKLSEWREEPPEDPSSGVVGGPDARGSSSELRRGTPE